MSSLSAPIEQIVENAGRKDAQVMIKNIKDDPDNAWGYDAENNIQVEDMYKAGIIDSLEITQDGIKFAAEAVGMLLTSRGGTAQIKDKD